VADREHGARTIGAAPERAHHVPRLAIDPDALDTREAIGHVDALERAWRRDEEPRDGAADARRRPWRLDRLADGARDRQVVERDADGRLDELGVVASAEPRGDLDHLRPVFVYPKLRVARAVLYSEYGDR